MTLTAEAAPSAADRELVLTRLIEASPKALYRCWTEPALLNGQEMPNHGVYLEVIPNQKLVFTDAYVKAWEPSTSPFMTVFLTFEDAGNGQTRYTARVRHFTVEGRERHEQMGFHAGWGQCADQLAALAKSL